VLDVHMPDVNGLDVARAIRDDEAIAATAVLVLSSDSLDDQRAHARGLGVAACLTKPIRAHELLEHVHRALVESASRRHAGAVGGPRAARSETRSLRVLVAEDNLVNQTLAVRLLESQGHRVSVASDGLEAVDAWSNGSFDLIIMDVQMPRLSGLEATRRIRAMEEEQGRDRVKILALTANAMNGDREECLEAGMDGYVSKPVKSKTLFDAITITLDGAAEAA
jgi:CheY-like chemotaxis protein